MEVAPTGTGDRHPTVQLHAAELIKYRDERRLLTFTLSSGEHVEGTVLWFDDSTIHVSGPDKAEMTVFKHAIAYYRAL